MSSGDFPIVGMTGRIARTQMFTNLLMSVPS
ncbi:hypothetical protein SAMN05445504_7474 [Burkholderia sp. CF099]|jgi:hypothetical protein|nr:hypothetical protein SAMN05445504_7474 [Burkholderia sp. CF099]